MAIKTVRPVSRVEAPVAIPDPVGSMEVVLGRESLETREDAACHVLACVKGEPIDREVMRQGQLLARWLGARLTVLYAFRLGESRNSRRAIDSDREYARAIGAPLVELPAYAPVKAVAEYAQARGVTHVVLSDDGAARHGLDSDALGPALLDRLGSLDLYVVFGPPRRQHAGAL